VALKSINRGTAGTRFAVRVSTDDITKDKPEKSLTFGLRSCGGRNNQGKVTMRHQGNGHKRKYRTIDFKRDKFDIPGKVISIEYDPNRSCRIMLVQYEDGDKRYILQPNGLNVGDTVISGESVKFGVGNTMPLSKIPEGTMVHNVELTRGLGGQLARSAGSYVELKIKEENFAQLKMPSGEIRRIPINCLATIGQVGNIEHSGIVLGSAGSSRHRGIRPTVRGVAQNACDHPHGGGRGKSKGRKHPRSPWGQPSKGFRTRNKKKPSSIMILKRRPV
jgi:large subunit ribosomal protein L2